MNQKELRKEIIVGIVYGLLLIMLFSNVASAAHTYDTSMADGTGAFANTPNPRNLSYTAGEGTSLMVLNIFTSSTTLRTGGAPTFNNKTMIQVGTTQSDTSEGAVEMWYLLIDASDTGLAHNISVPNTGSRNMRLHASTYKSATGVSALDVYAQKFEPNPGVANPNQTIVTTVNGDVMIDALFSGHGTVNGAVPNTGSTLFAQDGGNLGAASRYYLQPTYGSQQLLWTLTADDYALITAAFKEVTLSNISGYITDGSSGAGLNPATVEINSSPVRTTTTNATGYYDFTGLPNGTYVINASLTGYINNSITRTINGANIMDADIQLSPLLLFVPPTPLSLTSTQGNFWINYTWLPGSDPITDSYNVSVNDFWTNGTTETFNLSNVGAHGWSNITIYAFNNSGGGSLSLTPATSNTQVANNVPVQTLADTWAITAGNMLTFTVSANDADSDTLTFSTNATGGSLNQSTYSWMPSSADVGAHFWSFSSNDGYGGIAMNITTITVSETSGTYINGTVRSGGIGVEGVTVSTNTTISNRTDASGFYSLPVTAGAYELTASLEPEYYTNSSVTAVVETGVVVQDIELLVKPTGTISGSVRNA